MHEPAVVDWFEVISENFMGNHGYARLVLERLRSRHPVAMHGVSLSIGSTDPLDTAYLSALRDLADWLEPAWISDHLCWTGIAHTNTHDLLPMPLTEPSLAHVSERVQRVQEFLGRPLILENPSTYLEFEASTIPEWEFLSELCRVTGCGLLLDVNNVYVSAFNHGFDARRYIEAVSHRHVVQIHVAGHTDCGDLLVDTHDQPVPAPVWELYHLAQQLTGGVSALLEWDSDIPDFPDLEREVLRARACSDGVESAAGIRTREIADVVSNPTDFQLGVARDVRAG